MVTPRRESADLPMIGSLIRVSVRYPLAIAFIWLVFIALAGGYAAKLPEVAHGHGLTSSGDAAFVQQQLALNYGLPPDPVLLVFESDEGVSFPAFRAFIADALSAVSTLQGISVVASPLERQDMIKPRSAYAMLALEEEGSAIDARLADLLRSRLPHAAHYRVTMTGKPIVQAIVNEASRGDLAEAERFGIPIACLFLWLAFGGLLPAIIPIVAGVISVAVTMGALFFIGKQVTLSVFILDVVPMAGLALCLDFSLMIVSRFREEIFVHPPDQAVFRTMATSGKAVAYSGACVIAGLAGTFFIPLPMFTSLAIGAIVVTFISLFINFTLLPACLVIMGPYLRRKQRRVRNLTPRSGWERLPRLAMKRPFRTSLLCGGLLLACLLPLGGLRVAVPNADSLPYGEESRTAFHAYRQAFSTDKGAEVDLLAYAADGLWDRPEQQDLFDLLNRLNKDPQVGIALVVARPINGQATMVQLPQTRNLEGGGERDARLIRVLLHSEPASAMARNWVRDWQGGVTQGNLLLYAGGEAKFEQEVYDAVTGHLPHALLFVLITNYVLLFLLFRSILVPLKSLLMNMLSICAAFGLLAFVAQAGLFGMDGGRVAIMIPVFIFGLVFGISMDYGVFLLSRISEAYRRTGDNELAIAEGSGQSGKIISAAAAIMIAVTLPFAWGRIEGIKQLGIGISAAIFIDATVVRMLLVPSLMVMLGQWNWWGPAKKEGK